MVKMTPEQEAEYALGFGSPGATCRGLRRKPMTAWWNSGHPVGPRADACASGQIGLLRRLPLQHPGAAARRRTRRRFVLFYDVRHVDYAGHNADSPPTLGARHGSALAGSYSASRIIADAQPWGWSAACPTGPVRRAGHAAAVLHDTETGNGRIQTFS